MNKPINVLTGIDYWLDNLMCNVPELAMCYHVDGIVQSYEIVKTEELPYREGAEFPPGVIRDLATNLLSFLKANATKEGHTYWLCKGPDDDIVKLYDLTSLCDTTRDDNPYTLPVATLFYKMVRNMVSKSDHETRSKESGTIRTLLKHYLDMLNPEKFPEYHCTAAYMMSDLYIDDNVSEQSRTSDGSDIQDPESLNDDLPFEQDIDSDAYTWVDIKALSQPQQQRYRKHPDVERLAPIHGNLDKRAIEALKYLVEALRSNAIHHRVQTTADQDSSSTDAAAAYFCLVDRSEKEKNYGSCLRYLRLALNCYSAELKLQSMDHNNSSTECKKLLSYIMSIAGDCRLMIAHITSREEVEKYREQYHMMSEVDLEIQKVIDEVGINAENSEFSWVSELTPMMERNLFASVHAYEYAINVVRNLGDHERKRLNLLTKHFGNVRNEMGVYWMNKCAQAAKNFDHEAAKEVKDQFRKSFESFDAGIQAFEKINDLSNIALLHSKLGRLMRYYAQFYAPVVNGVRQEFSQHERQSYQKAFDYFHRGLKLIENRSDLSDVYRTLSWELSNTYFTMATSLQDYAPLITMSQDDIEKEIIDCMTRALKHLDIELNTPSSNRYTLAKYRAATIHHRSASLLHNNFRTQNNAPRRKRLRNLASLHYRKALYATKHSGYVQ
ncbi:unnamed protein product [Rotaria magnacalcarata]|uniref:Erythroid differentiation-related factor 1 n=2 Tax=Rotaria magnacalcarata TaxID=392030 RepID=A0A819X8V4_9BILA|nr:unnamed protein product [Rotaria magnacalcarata]